MKIHVGEAFIEREKRDRPECKMHVVAVTRTRVELAYAPGGTIAVSTSRKDFVHLWERVVPMRVWGGVMQAPRGLPLPGAAAHNRQARVIVCAKTKKRAIELVNASVFGPALTASRMANYWCMTGNARELAIATREGVWYTPLDQRSGEYLVAGLRA